MVIAAKEESQYTFTTLQLGLLILECLLILSLFGFICKMKIEKVLGLVIPW